MLIVLYFSSQLFYSEGLSEAERARCFGVFAKTSDAEIERGFLAGEFDVCPKNEKVQN